MQHLPFALGYFAALALAAGCASEPTLTPGQQALQQACFTTADSVRCLALADSDDSERLRQRVEDFYPSACFNGDHDDDGTLDTFDHDYSEEEDDSKDPLHCDTCNRGPGTQGDFRLDIEGSEIELDRGTVSAMTDNSVDIPTPDGLLTILMTDDTDFEDGVPSPGAEIRARGYIDEGGNFIAERLKVLCPGAAAIDDSDVPEGAEPPNQDDDPVVL